MFEVTENSADSYYATVIYVPAEFTAQYEGSLPGDESCRDYKIYSDWICGMNADYQYAVAERKVKERE